MTTNSPSKEEPSKSKRTKFSIETPVPEVEEKDEEKNPYPDKVEGLGIKLKKKVTIEQDDHRYLLQDENGIYADYILTCSSIYDFVRILCNEPERARAYVEERKFTRDQVVYLAASASHQEDVIAPAPIIYPGKMEALNRGKLFHWYVEQRIFQREVLPPPEVEVEVMQFERFFRKLPPGFFSKCEVTLGSFRHRICGTADAMHFTGKEWVIFDWKNSASIFHPKKIILDQLKFTGAAIGPRSVYCPHFCFEKNARRFGITVDRVFHPSYSSISVGLYKYMLQQAAYRKLHKLEGFPTSHICYLGVVNPALRRCEDEEGEIELRILELDLSQPLPQYGGISCIQRTQQVFNQMKAILSEIYKDAYRS